MSQHDRNDRNSESGIIKYGAQICVRYEPHKRQFIIFPFIPATTTSLLFCLYIQYVCMYITHYLNT